MIRLVLGLVVVLFSPNLAAASGAGSVFLHCTGLKDQITGDYPDPINVEVDLNGEWLRPGAGGRLRLSSRDPNLWNYKDWTDADGPTVSFMPDDLGLMIHPETGPSRVFYCLPFDNPFRRDR